MSEERQDQQTMVDLIEDWQTGFFLILACVVVAIVTTVLVSPANPQFGIVIFFVSAILAFVVISYLLYGR